MKGWSEKIPKYWEWIVRLCLKKKNGTKQTSVQRWNRVSLVNKISFFLNNPKLRDWDLFIIFFKKNICLFGWTTLMLSNDCLNQASLLLLGFSEGQNSQTFRLNVNFVFCFYTRLLHWFSLNNLKQQSSILLSYHHQWL